MKRKRSNPFPRIATISYLIPLLYHHHPLSLSSIGMTMMPTDLFCRIHWSERNLRFFLKWFLIPNVKPVFNRKMATGEYYCDGLIV